MNDKENNLSVLVLNPMTAQTQNVIRDVLYGCWCAGKRIGGATVPPFSLIQLATLLKREGFDTEFLDAQAEQKDVNAVKEVIDGFDLVVCSTSTMSFQEDADYLLALKQENPKLQTVILGSHPTFMPKYAMAHEGIDFIVKREPEYIIRDLCRTLSGQDEKPFSEIGGLGYRTEGGEVHDNDFYPFIKDLDELPHPDVSMLPKDIHYFNPLVRRMPYMTATTSRGCPAKCTFCTAPYFDGEKVRFQSADYVINQIKYLIKEGFREVYFRDDTFFVKKKRDHEICHRIIDEKLDITWIANARVAMMDEETMKLAKEAGCHTLKFGIESGNQEILDRMRKGYKVEQAREIFKVANKIGMNTHAHVMLGNPGDTRETIQDTIDFVLELNPTTATFGICTPYPGTPLFAEVAEKHPDILDGTTSNLEKLHVEGIFNELYCDVGSEELGKLVKSAYRQFYMRPSYIFNTAFKQIRSLNDIQRVSLAGTRVLDFSIRGA